MRVAKWLATPVIGALALLIGQALGPAVPLHPVVAYCASFLCIGALVLATSAQCPVRTRRGGPTEGAMVIAPVLLAILALGWVALSSAVTAPHAAIVLIALLVIGSAVGTAVGDAIEEVGHLLFVVIISSAADAASVLHPSGPSNAIAQSEEALSLLALPFAFLGTDATPPLLGVGDVVFAALYVACARRQGLGQTRTLIALAAGFVATMVVVIATELPVPALPFLGLAMLIAHPEARRPPLRDRTRGFAVIGLLAVVLLGLWWSGS